MIVLVFRLTRGFIIESKEIETNDFKENINPKLEDPPSSSVYESEVGDVESVDLSPYYQPELSVIIPTLNESETIGICIKKVLEIFEEQGISGEIIVSDSSTDDTPDIAESLGAIIVKPPENGYGSAYISALEHARGRYIVLGDGDNTYDFKEIPVLLEPLRQEEADMVIGSRFKGNIMPEAMSWLHRYVGNPLLTGLLNIFFHTNITDAHSGLRAFTRDTLQKLRLKSQGMEFASEMLIVASRLKLRISEVPISYYPRTGESKLNSFVDGWRHLKFMLFYAPTYVYFLPGVSMFIVGLFLITSAYMRIDIGIIPGLHSLIGGNFLIIIGYQTFLLGIMAQLWGEKAGFIINDEFPINLIRKINMQKGIITGLALILIGSISLASIFYDLFTKGYEFIQFNYADIFSYTTIIIGFLTIYNSFLISMIKQE